MWWHIISDFQIIFPVEIVVCNLKLNHSENRISVSFSRGEGGAGGSTLVSFTEKSHLSCKVTDPKCRAQLTFMRRTCPCGRHRGQGVGGS